MTASASFWFRCDAFLLTIDSMSAESTPEGTGPKLKLRPPGARGTPPPDRPNPAPAAKEASPEEAEKPRERPRLSVSPEGSDQSVPSTPDAPQAETPTGADSTPPVRVKLRARLPMAEEPAAAPASELAGTPPPAENPGAEGPRSIAREEPRKSVAPFEPAVPAETAESSTDDVAKIGLSKLKLKAKEETGPSTSQTEPAGEHFPPPPAAQPAAPYSARKRPRSSRSVMRIAIAGGGLLIIAVACFLAYVEFFPSVPPPLPPLPKPSVVKRTIVAPKPAARPQPPPAAQAETVAPTAGSPKAAATNVSASTPAAAPAPKAAAPVPPPPPPKPSPEFSAFVDQLNISGLHVGSPTRAIINGVTYKDGDVINHDLGVVFVGVDPKTQMLVFKDRTGAVLRRAF